MVVDVTLDRLGWDDGWTTAFAPFRAQGLRPARVVAVHRETSIVRDAAGDRPAMVSGGFRYVALAQSDFPTVGDWVALDQGDVVAAVLPVGASSSGWRPTPRGMARASMTSRSWRRTS